MRRTLGAIGAIACVVLALVSTGAATASAVDPLQLTVGSLERIGSLDPRRGTSEIAREVWKLEYPTLTTLDPKTLDPRPGLASAWTPTANGRGWIYKLRRGLAWSDGKPVTAADVVYSLEHARDERWPYAANTFDDLTARALDPNTIEITRRASNSPGGNEPADPSFPGLPLHVVPEHVFSKFTDIDKDVVKRSVSDGTWRVTQRSDDSVQLDVPTGLAGPAATRIVFRSYRSADALVDALSRGDVDVISGLPSSYIGRLEALPDATVNHAGDGTRYTLTIGKPGDATLADPRVRQAISMAIDRDQLVESAVRGVGTAGVVAPIARGKSWALDDATVQSLTESLDAQPARARELLAATAPPIDRKLTIRVPFDRAGRRTGTFVRRALAAVGIETELAPPEGAAPDLLLAHTAISSDPTDALDQLTCADCAERLRQYRSTDSDPARLDAAHDMSEQATEQATDVGLFQPDTLQAFRSDNVTGFLRDPEIRSLVVFGPTISQYSQLSTAFPPPGEQLSNTSYIVGGVIVLALCVATFMVVVWIRRRYAN